MNNDVYILGIETSCDETSMAIVKNGCEDIGTSTYTQIAKHASYGGVVPEIASRMHTENITLVLEDLLKKTNFDLKNIDAIAVTYAPGLLGSLLVGLEFAKTLSLVYSKPLIKVHHTAGHIYANNLEHTIKFPTLALIVSGGHTDLVKMTKDYEFEILGSTLDDAIGETYDKVARVLDMPYPGGPNIEKKALEGKNNYSLPKVLNNETYNFSFSGLKSAVINIVHNNLQRGEEINKCDLACSFQTTAIEQLIRKSELAIKNTGIKDFVLAGGVSANNYLREQLNNLCEQYNVALLVPSMKYCTDNGTMIGAAAYPLYKMGIFTTYNLNAESQKSLFESQKISVKIDFVQK